MPSLLWAGGILVLTPVILLAGFGALVATTAMAIRDATRGAAPGLEIHPAGQRAAAFQVATVAAPAPEPAVVLAFPHGPARPDRFARQARELSLTHAA